MFDALGVRAVLSAATWKTRRRFDSSAGTPAAIPASTRTPTRIHGHGSYTTSTLSTTKTRRSGFSRRTRAGRTTRSSWIRSTRGARPSSRTAANHGRRSARTPGRTAGLRQQSRDRATIERYAGDSVSLRVETACPGLLVLPDTYFPGWKATVNGREETIYPTDGAFRGVIVPEGNVARRIPLRAACLADRGHSRRGRTRGFLAHRIDQPVGAADAAARGFLRASTPRAEQQLLSLAIDQSRLAGRVRAHASISPMLTATSRCRIALGRRRFARSSIGGPSGFVCRSWPNR